jgi:rhodanese-related sulfurtransferase/polyisoprenoid-binding protein YceI
LSFGTSELYAMGTAQLISSEELKNWIDGGKEFLLVDVLPEEYYSEKHLPSAKNACVYEMAFLDQISELAPDKNKPIVVYGPSARSLSSSTAAEKLLKEGYVEVYDYQGGTVEWESRKFPIDGESADNDPKRDEASASPQAGGLEVDIQKSKALWIGRNLVNQHYGSIKIARGELDIQDGTLAGARFLFDMTTMKCNDIADAELNKLLVEHLTSEDFFDVRNHPTAEFVMTQAVRKDEETRGRPNHLVMGNLTIKDITHEVEFPAFVGELESGIWVAQAYFDIDRTDWKVLYGSGKFYEKLGKHLVNDFITIQVSVIARKV